MKKIKHKILNFLLSKLFNAITEEDIININKKGYFVGKTRLDSGQIESIKNQANAIIKSDIWKLINNNLKYLANYRMYHNSENIDDMVFGKAMLYNLDILNILFKKISER